MAFLSNVERGNMIGFLKAHTTYTIEEIMSKDDDQLFWMHKRIKEAIPQYIEEILAKTAEGNYYGYSYTKKELRALTYNELADIRRSLGIRKSRKKVVKQEPALEDTIKQGQQVLQQISESELEQRIFEHEEFLSEAELREIYGEDIPSNEELLSKGIVNLDNSEITFKELFIKQLTIKKAIMRVLKEIEQTLPILLPMPLEDIETLEYNDLVRVYLRVCEALPNIPTLDSIETDTEKKLGLH